MKKFIKSFREIVTIDNLLLAWQEFLAGKKKRNDVVIFQARLMDNIFKLYNDLINKTYVHGGYQAFNISDPKPRNIHKATVRDRLLHHLLYREVYKYFDQRFINDSYSCRLNKGTHLAIKKFATMIRRVSLNNHQTAWVLKCDIRKFFASISHQGLRNILAECVEDIDVRWLFDRVVDSFETIGRVDVGLPLGNLTSQLLVNVYMNEFDQFVKQKLKVKYYIRYADDFLFLSADRSCLMELRIQIEKFLLERLKLNLHPQKIFLKTAASGVDFLGWVQFENHRILRTTTKNRMLKRIKINSAPATLNSYQALLEYGATYKLKTMAKLNNRAL